MKKWLTISVLLLVSMACAQNVIIQGTVRDPNNNAYANGSGKVVLVPQNVQWLVNNTNPVNSPVVISGLDSFGHFSISLTNTGIIAPASMNPQWQFSFCSQTYAVQAQQVCFTMTPMSLTTSQDISTQIQAQAAYLPTGGGGGGGTPGGVNAQIQFNNSNAFGGISNAVSGSVLASAGTGLPPAMQPKIVVDMRDGVNGGPGVKCDGTTDDTAAIQNDFNYYGRGGAGATDLQFQFPIGNCVISNEVVYEGTNSLGMRLVGQNGFSGAQEPATSLVWNGPNFGTMMLILGCNGCSVENISFVAPDSFQGRTNAQNALWFDASNSLPASVAYNISAISRSGNVVTSTTTATHAVTPGRIVKVAGSTGGSTSFNGTFQVLYSNDNTHISWIQKGANESGTASTGTVTNYKSAPSNNILFSHMQVGAGVAVQSTISAISAQNPVLVTTSTPHYIQNGDTVCLRGVTDTSYIGCYIATVTSSTTASLVVLAYTGLSPSGTASSGGTLLSGSSGIRFAHPDSITPQISSIHGSDFYIQGDQQGGTANCLEMDVGGNAKDFLFENPGINGCRYGFNGFASGNFNVVGLVSDLITPDRVPTLATADFVNVAGQITVTGAEEEASFGRFFLGGGNIHLDGVSFQGGTPPDGVVIRQSGLLKIDTSYFQAGGAPTNADTPIIQMECGPQLVGGSCSFESTGNFYANTATGGGWTNAGYLPVLDGSGNVFFTCPGTYCNVPVNIQSIGDIGSTSPYQTDTIALGNISNTSTLNAAVAVSLINPVTATNGTNQSSPPLNFIDAYYSSGSTQPNSWVIQDVLGTGSAPSSDLTYTQSGSSGPASVKVPALKINNGANLSLSQDVIAGAGVLDVGNGPNDFSGTVQLDQVNFGGISGTISSFTDTPINGGIDNPVVSAMGMLFSVKKSVTASALGRYYIAGNSHNHNINLWVSTNTTTPLASGTILAASSSDSLGFKWVSVAPVTLTPGNLYAIAVDEDLSGGDTWYDHHSQPLQPQIGHYGAVEGNTGGYPNVYGPLPNQMYSTPALQFTTQVPDTSISRPSAGLVSFDTTTPGNAAASAKVASILPGILYSTAGTALPSCASGIKGETAVVSDATTPTYMGAYSSGGTITTAVICSYNGSSYAWLTH
jgi:hypothetical protein